MFYIRQVLESDMHPAGAATDSFDRDIVLGLASFKQEGLYEIDAAGLMTACMVFAS
jgi:hypothetical protein